MYHAGMKRCLLARLWRLSEDGDEDGRGSPEPAELRFAPSRWSRSPEPEASERWSASPEDVDQHRRIGIGAPDTEEALMELLERKLPREGVANSVRIRWALKTVYDLYKITGEEIDELTWLDDAEKEVLKGLCV